VAEVDPGDVAKADQGEAKVRDASLRIAHLTVAFLKVLMDEGVPPTLLLPLVQQYEAHICMRFL
jgi:hypothetical protein